MVSSNAVVLLGCVDGDRFTVPMNDSPGAQSRVAGSREYRLEGNRDMLRLLKPRRPLRGTDRHARRHAAAGR
jgi:hypothetical protein